MYRLAILFVVLSVGAHAKKSERRVAKDAQLKKKTTRFTPEKSLAGDITREKAKAKEIPILEYTKFQTALELQVAERRREQIADLQKIIKLSQDDQEKPDLLLRLGELYWEESKHFFFEAHKTDDDKIRAIYAKDKAGIRRAEAEKKLLLKQSRNFAYKAIKNHTRIVRKYRKYKRVDEVLYYLGLNLMEVNDTKRALLAYKELIKNHPKSQWLPDTYMAMGEYYFGTSESRRSYLQKALANYKAAAKFPESRVYGYALYKQGWCYFNLGDFQLAMDRFKAVVLYAKFAGAAEVEDPHQARKRKGRLSLAQQARSDYVHAYSRSGKNATSARGYFSKLADTKDELRGMMKQLAKRFYLDGKDKEAAVAYDILIREQPTSPEAPGFQAHIVDCVMRAGNKRMTVTQVHRLKKIMSDVLSTHHTLDEKDNKLLDEARQLSERTISNLAVNWHNEARKTKDAKTLQYTNAVYDSYLALFPQHKKAYALRFFWAELLFDNMGKYDKAAQEYTTVFKQDIEKLQADPKAKPGKYMVHAAYNTILALDAVVKRAVASRTLKTPVITDAHKSIPILQPRKALLESCERYLKHIKTGKRLVEIQYKAGKIYYDYNHLEEAVSLFSDIALRRPRYRFSNGSLAGELAANLVLDSYNILEDWKNVNEWAKKFYNEKKLARGKFRVQLAKVIERSSFKLISQLEEKGEYNTAANAYLQFLVEWPKSDLADKALFNAAIDFYNGKQLNRAIEVRKELIQKHPKSTYIPKTMFALAEGYEAVADFGPAAHYYEVYANAYAEKKRLTSKARKRRRRKRQKQTQKQFLYVGRNQHWEEKKAQDALFNAGVFREGLEQYEMALKNRQRYLALWPKSKDTEPMRKSILTLYEKMGQWRALLSGIEAHERRNLRNPSKVLAGEGRLAHIFESKLESPRDTRRIYKRIWKYYRKLPRKLRDKLSIQALDAVGRASFAENEDDWAYYNRLKLRWSTVQNIGELQNSIKRKAKALTNLQKLYTQTVSLKAASPAICAMYRIGKAYDAFAEQLIHFPVPKGLEEEDLYALRPNFEQQALQPQQKAKEAFETVVLKSQELDVFNACSTGALEMLRTKYAPDKYPTMPETPVRMRAASMQPAVGGSGLLAVVQETPAGGGGTQLKEQALFKLLGRKVFNIQAAPVPSTQTPAPDEAVEHTP